MMQTTTDAAKGTGDLPKWDLATIFPSLDSGEFDDAVGAFRAKLDALAAHLDDRSIGLAATAADGVSQDEVASVLSELNGLGSEAMTLRAYVHGHITVDSRNERAQQRMSELEPLMTLLTTLQTRITAWVGELSVDSLAEQSPYLAAHRYALRKMNIEAQRLMTPAEEALAAQLAETGGSAWAKLYGNFSSQIEVDVNGTSLPMSAVRNFAHDRDAQTRRDAYEAELAAWKQHELVIASAMNAIKGEASLLSAKRGWSSLLDEALFRANMDRQALDAMLDAAREFFPVLRRYLQAKARLLGHDRGLPFYDLFAPIGQSSQWAYGEAATFIEHHFRGYSDKLADYALRCFDERWIDAAPAAGKRDGAFCMPVRGDESRILMNFKPAFGSVATLAHELGHGYHNLCLAERTMLQRNTPMTLAETASIFCETVIKRAALREAQPSEQLAILEASLQGACQIIVDISSRFEFESTVINNRQQRELSARELCEIMRDAQRHTYGDGLHSEYLHPYMWAAKPHYYAWRSFYNFPYMFGMLFGLGLYAIYQAEPTGFQERYDDLLSSTGMDDAATLAGRFGIDIRDKQFWNASLQFIEEDVKLFEQLAGGVDRAS